MFHTFRAYIPDVEIQQNWLTQVATASLTGKLLETTVSPDLTHRKIWCGMAIDTAVYASWEMQFDLVGTLHEKEVIRIPVARSASTFGIQPNFRFFARTDAAYGNNPETLLVVVPGGNNIQYEFSPFQMHIACDKFYIDPIKFSNANWDAYLFTLSQRGV